MTGRIYLLESESILIAMREAPSDSKKPLQKLLARPCNRFAWEWVNVDELRRWLASSSCIDSRLNDSK